MKRVLIFFCVEGTGEKKNQIMESALGQGRVRSMRGGKEVKFGRRWKTTLRRCVEVNEW